MSGQITKLFISLGLAMPFQSMESLYFYLSRDTSVTKINVEFG